MKDSYEMRGGYPTPTPPSAPKRKSRKILPVKVITDADLEENGGKYSKSGGAITEVIVIDRADVSSKDLASGPVRTVFVVSETDTRHVMGGPALRVVEYADLPGRPESGKTAMMVKVISGALP